MSELFLLEGKFVGQINTQVFNFLDFGNQFRVNLFLIFLSMRLDDFLLLLRFEQCSLSLLFLLSLGSSEVLVVEFLEINSCDIDLG